MAKLYNGARMTVSGTPGAGDLTLAAAVSPFLTFAQANVADGDVVSYSIIDTAGFEQGTATYVSATTKLAGRTVRRSSGAGNVGLISVSGAAHVLISVGKEDLDSLTNSTVFGRTLLTSALLFQNYLSRLTLAWVNATTFQVFPGAAADSTNATIIVVPSSFNKTTAAWAVGDSNGSLDTGTIAANTCYHAFLIQRSDTSGYDALTSLSATAPTMPANYDRKRRIGSLFTNASSQWTLFFQWGDRFLLDQMIRNVNGQTGDTTTHTMVCSTPTDIVTRALIVVSGVAGAGADARYYVSPLVLTDRAVSEAATSAITFGGLGASGTEFTVELEIETDTSAGIRYRAFSSSATFYGHTRGWVDRRGQDG